MSVSRMIPRHGSAVFLLLACLAAVPALAAVTVTTYAPGDEAAAIAGRVIEDFEDTTLEPGFSITLSQWRDASNNLTADPAVTFSGSLPSVWSPASTIGFPDNAWDGTHAFVNGAGYAWGFPYAATMEITLDMPLADVGVGLSNFQHDASDAFTFHTLLVNGVDMGKLENMPNWVSTASGKNFYLHVIGDGDTPIESITILADDHFDGMVLDMMALGALAVPAEQSTMSAVKALFR
ncbi:hypothetical protein KDK88_04690 [bacterium]|nr:hypothetical protein [bacterium]